MTPPDGGLLERASVQLKNGGPPEKTTVRNLLRSLRYERRGRFVVESVRNALRKYDLVTVPDFDSVWIDAEVELQRRPDRQPAPAAAQRAPVPATALLQAQAALEPSGPDPAFNIGKFEAANKGVQPVAPDSSLETAVTVMMASGYSQLPVMTTERTVKGGDFVGVHRPAPPQ